MEYDSETGNYYDHARYYNPRLGRFMSPDPDNFSGFMDPDNPQSWNGYSYVLNNPETLTDPWGLCYAEAMGVVDQQTGQLVYGWSGTEDCHGKSAGSSSSSDVAQILWQELFWATFSHAALPLHIYSSGTRPAFPALPQTQGPQEGQPPSCFGVFYKAAFAEPLHRLADAVKEVPEDLEQVGQALVGSGAYAGVWGFTRTGAASVSAGIAVQGGAEVAARLSPYALALSVIASEGFAITKEVKAVRNGTCHGTF